MIDEIMQMAAKQFQTNYRILTLLAILLFVGLGFVDPVAGVAKGDCSLWSYVGIIFRTNRAVAEEIGPKIVYMALLTAMVAVVIAWVLQALIVVLYSRLRGGRHQSPKPQA
ncbi:MAG TPA: hypothetical protein VKS79_07235 [Gemmataceae bacterium]|nr:hypothetical protein [Gemmataceae bacterium]